MPRGIINRCPNGRIVKSSIHNGKGSTTKDKQSPQSFRVKVRDQSISPNMAIAYCVLPGKKRLNYQHELVCLKTKKGHYYVRRALQHRNVFVLYSIHAVTDPWIFDKSEVEAIYRVSDTFYP